MTKVVGGEDWHGSTRVGRSPLYAATLAAEWSLVRSRAHYPGDIFAGAAIAIAVALVASEVWPAQRAAASAPDDVSVGPPAGESGR